MRGVSWKRKSKTWNLFTEYGLMPMNHLGRKGENGFGFGPNFVRTLDKKFRKLERRIERLEKKGR